MMRRMPRMRAYTGEHHGGASTSTTGSSSGSRNKATSGSERIASPTHEGATMRMRSVVVRAANGAIRMVEHLDD